MLALELDDRALALAADGELRSVQPAVVHTGTGGNRAGAGAWDVQREHPTQVSTRHWADLARAPVPAAAIDLITAELRERFAEAAVQALPDSGRGAEEAQPLWLLAPAVLEPDALGIVLAAVRSLGQRVAGFADAAVVSAAALGLEGPALVLELGLHHLGVTALDCGERVRRRRAAVARNGGLIELYESWLQLIAAAMVKRTRFDPLHEGVTEQQLFTALPGLAREAIASGAARAVLEVRGERFEAELSRDQFAQAAEARCRELLRMVHELRPAGARLTIVAPRVLGELPGLREALEPLAGCELVLAYEGFAALAATRLLEEASAAANPGDVRLLRALPRSAAAIAEQGIAGRARLGGGAGGAGRAPSHLLFEGRAVALGAAPLEIGRGAALAPGAIVLPEGLAGVSRRHCSLHRDADGVTLIDHSRFGTWVNGERVAGRVRLRAGDRLRIGDPGVTVDLIAVGD